MKRPEYVSDELTVSDLKDIAEERHLVGYSSLRKDELIDLINDDIKQEMKKAKAEAKKAEKKAKKKVEELEVPAAKEEVKEEEPKGPTLAEKNAEKLARILEKKAAVAKPLELVAELRAGEPVDLHGYSSEVHKVQGSDIVLRLKN